MPGYQELVAWQKGLDLVIAVYEATSGFPTTEMYGLANQLRRAAVSIPSNIAEGHGRVSGREFAHHLAIAYGSLCELETQLLIAQRLGYVDNDTGDVLRSQAAEVGRPINGLSRAIARKTSTTPMP